MDGLQLTIVGPHHQINTLITQAHLEAGQKADFRERQRPARQTMTLKQQIDIPTTPIIVCARTKQQDLHLITEDLSGCCLDHLNFGFT